MKTIKQWQTEVHQLAKTKGWYDTPRSALEYHMLMVSEIAEASEEVRKGSPAIYFEKGHVVADVNLEDNSITFEANEKPEGEFIELADAVIRIMDYFEYNNVSLELMLERKHNYNKTRSYRHGGKKL